MCIVVDCLHIMYTCVNPMQIYRASVSDNSGSQVPLSSVLSPLSLAASIQIDSYFSSSFIPLYTVNVHFQDIQATLLHSTNTKSTSG